MPGGKRTDQISQRDLEVLEFVARFGVVSRDAVATWARTGSSVTRARERRLRDAGLIEVRAGVWGEGRLLSCTRRGLAVSGRRELSPARFSLASVGHESAVAELAAAFERDGQRLLSEREILAREREEGERRYSAKLESGRFHRADLIRTDEGGLPEAIEVELTPKGADRLDRLLRAWRRAVLEKRVRRVAYICPPRTRGTVERAVQRTRTEVAIDVRELGRAEEPE